jgi:pyruvate/2-oxoglutarate dehydrogenase complex dihydrolipoamide acyltransferase (E2) component
VLTICAFKNKKILEKDGSVIEREFIPVYLAVDHRYIDGAIGSKMIKEVKF